MQNNKPLFFANECKLVNNVCSPYSFTFEPGSYLLEVWGAQGGNSSISFFGSEMSTFGVGGKGGYSRGILRLSTKTPAFIYVGQKGFVIKEESKSSSGTFGGGGRLIVEPNNGHGTIGGGASDIRLIKDDLFHRVLVAGGGGGASGGRNDVIVNGGDAGGIQGYEGYCDTDKRYYTDGGKQEKGGKTHGCYWGTVGSDGEFGEGGYSYNNHGTNYGGSGGGGWFGGAGGCHRLSGAGGSGYAYNFSSYKPSGFMQNSKYYLFSASVFDGKSKFPKATEKHVINSFETGHEGNGAVRITSLFYAFCSYGRKAGKNLFVICLMIFISC